MKKAFFKSLHYLLLGGLVFAGGGVLAQGGNTYPQLENCWQRFNLTGSGPFTLLKTSGDTAKFRITHSGSATSFKYFHIWSKHKDWGWMNHPVTGYPVSAFSIPSPFDSSTYWMDIYGVTSAYGFSTGILEINTAEYDSISITLISENEIYEGGPLEKQIVLSNAKVGFTSINQAISITPKNGKTCFTFNDFQFDAAVNVSGFCGKFKTSRLRLANPSAPNNLNLPGNYQSPEVNPNDGFSTVIPAVCDPPIADPCGTTSNPPYPVPCNCLDFIIDFEFEPCYSTLTNCPNLFGSKTIKICCKCDSRTGDPQN